MEGRLLRTGLIIAWTATGIQAQEDCESYITVKLRNINGSFYQGQQIKLARKGGGAAFEMTSDAKGEATFSLPCNTLFELTASNYTQKKEIRSPDFAGGKSIRTLTYAPDMAEREKLFAMSGEERAAVDATASALPDTLRMKGQRMEVPAMPEHFSDVIIILKYIDGTPLAGENLCIAGSKRGKCIKGTTGKDGALHVYLPKGDTYTLNFKYNKNYASSDIAYTKGHSNTELGFSYLGTREIERRKKEEAERVAAEEKRLKAEEERFVAYCKKLGISPAEGRKREVADYIKSLGEFKDTVISAALNRNNWNDKLIVCDLTGSMSPYSAQLSLWYKLHEKKEKNLQFIFFNDGDNKPDNRKKIGETGGIYYSRSKGFDSLANFAARVSSAGYGGDCPENNMEALLKGTKMAGPYKELVMIVDNNAPVKDIELLKQFNVPVHIILCGVSDWILLDYLLIAWKTKGSLHTIEQDISKIANMMDGEEITIGGKTYRIMGGEFVRITKG